MCGTVSPAPGLMWRGVLGVYFRGGGYTHIKLKFGPKYKESTMANSALPLQNPKGPQDLWYNVRFLY